MDLNFIPTINRLEAQGAVQGDGEQTYALRFRGDLLDLTLVLFKNIALSVVTFGFYSFWARAEGRRFLCQSTEFLGHRFRYEGNGKEAFYNWLRFAGVVAAVIWSIILIKWFVPKAERPLTLVYPLLLAAGWAYVQYAARRYLWQKITWRGLRLDMEPVAWKFMLLYLGGGFLTLLSLGFYFPVWKNQLYAFKIGKSRFGSLPLSYTGKHLDAFLLHLEGFILSVATLGIYYPWHKAMMWRFRASHTWIGDQNLGMAHGKLQIEGHEVFWLFALNILGTIATFGVALPWILSFDLQFLMKRLCLVGQVDFEQC